jgi:hypothetical protein
MRTAAIISLAVTERRPLSNDQRNAFGGHGLEENPGCVSAVLRPNADQEARDLVRRVSWPILAPRTLRTLEDTLARSRRSYSPRRSPSRRASSSASPLVIVALALSALWLACTMFTFNLQIASVASQFITRIVFPGTPTGTIAFSGATPGPLGITIVCLTGIGAVAAWAAAFWRARAGRSTQLAATVSTPLACPRCQSELVLRRNRGTGEEFWGCKGYPGCRYTQPLAA